MLFSRSKNEYRMCRRFLECLEKCVECRLGKHVDLVYDIDAVLTHLRRDTYLIHKCLNVLDTVV